MRESRASVGQILAIVFALVVIVVMSRSLFGPALLPLGPGWEPLIRGGLILLFIGGIGICLFKLLSPSSKNQESDEDAIKLLRQRYAKGELSTEEYRRILEELRRS